jgi:phosphohistidine phosphatase
LLEALRRAPDSARRVMLVGHNPGMEHLAMALAGPRSKPKALSRLRKKFPTAALAQIDFETENWSDVDRADGRLRRLVRPKDLA